MGSDSHGARGIERGFQTRADQTETRTRLRHAVGRDQQAEGRRDFRPDLGLSQLYAVEHRGHVERLEKHQIGSASCRDRCVSTCRSRWSSYHKKKKHTQHESYYKMVRPMTETS